MMTIKMKRSQMKNALMAQMGRIDHAEELIDGLLRIADDYGGMEWESEEPELPDRLVRIQTAYQLYYGDCQTNQVAPREAYELAIDLYNRRGQIELVVTQLQSYLDTDLIWSKTPIPHHKIGIMRPDLNHWVSLLSGSKS